MATNRTFTMIKPDAVEKGHSLVVVNAEMRNDDLSATLESRRMMLRENKTYTPGEMEKFFVDMDYYLSFIGAVVIRRNVWTNRDRKSYFGTEFVHVGVIFQEPLPETTLIIAEPYITIRYGNAQWSSRHFEIWMFKWPMLLWSFKHISDEAKLKVSYREPWRKFRVLVYQRSIGQYNSAIYSKYLSGIQTARVWKFFAIAICFTPKWMCVFSCGIYFFLKRSYAYFSKK